MAITAVVITAVVIMVADIMVVAIGADTMGVAIGADTMGAIMAAGTTAITGITTGAIGTSILARRDIMAARGLMAAAPITALMAIACRGIELNSPRAGKQQQIRQKRPDLSRFSPGQISLGQITGHQTLS